KWRRAKIRPRAARATKTQAQPRIMPTSAPTAAPSGSDTKSPETEKASQAARRSDGAAAATSAYMDGATPAAATPANVLATMSHERFGAAAVSRLAAPSTSK